MKLQSITPRYVKAVPSSMEEGILYISSYGSAIHRCFCGCGSVVVTPLGPAQWHIAKEGETVTLRPSIGSWNLPCQSHYFITSNKVEWLATGRDASHRARAEYGARSPRQMAQRVRTRRKRITSTRRLEPLSPFRARTAAYRPAQSGLTKCPQRVSCSRLIEASGQQLYPARHSAIGQDVSTPVPISAPQFCGVVVGLMEASLNHKARRSEYIPRPIGRMDWTVARNRALL